MNLQCLATFLDGIPSPVDMYNNLTNVQTRISSGLQPDLATLTTNIGLLQVNRHGMTLELSEGQTFTILPEYGADMLSWQFYTAWPLLKLHVLQHVVSSASSKFRASQGHLVVPLAAVQPSQIMASAYEGPDLRLLMCKAKALIGVVSLKTPHVHDPQSFRAHAELRISNILTPL